MSRNKCCVPGCQVIKDDGIPLHRFPDPKTNLERYMTWVSSIGDLHLRDKKYVYNNLRVCRKHFKPVYFYPNHHLCKLAIPELQLSAQEQERAPENLPSTSGSQLIMGVDTQMGQQSTSENLPLNMDVDIPLEQYGILENHPSTSFVQSKTISVDPVPVTRPRSHQTSMEFIKVGQSSTSKHKKHRKNTKQIQPCNMRRMTPKRISKTKAFQIVAKNLKDENAKTFFLMQVKQAGKRHVRGRRFPMEEKVLALSLYKPSPKAYRIMSKFCILPSRRTGTGTVGLDWNCGTYNVVPGKPLKTAVKANSAHQELWRASLPVLKSMKFDTSRNVPSLTGWVKTIENIRKLVKFLHQKGMKAILLRRLNQDALENFFGAIRAHGYANIMPNCSSFEASYKTLLLNNLTSKHSVGANCEADNDFCLDSLKIFLFEADEQIINEGISFVEYEHMYIELIDTTSMINFKDKGNVEKCAAIGYCSGWLARQAKCKVYKNCQTCLKSMETDYTEDFHGFIKIKEYDSKRWLCYPSRCLFDFFAQVENITFTILKSSPLKNNIAEYIKLVVAVNIEVNFVTCETHKDHLIDYLIKKSIVFFIHIWCKEVSHLLTGKALEFDKDDQFKKKAHDHYKNNRGRKRLRQTGTEVNV